MIGWQADLIRGLFTAQRVMALGVLMIDVSFLFLVYLPFSGEKLGVYLMSFLALLFAGIVAVIEATRYEEETEAE